MPTLQPLTPQQITDMGPEKAAAYFAEMMRQAEMEKAAIQAASKARIEWETFKLVARDFGYGAVYYNAQAEPDGKSRYISLFLYELLGREISYPLVYVDCNNPKKSGKTVDEYRLGFIQSILEAAGLEWQDFTHHHNSPWKGLPFNRLESLEGSAIVKFAYPIRLALRLRETAAEYTDKETGEVKPYIKRRYGFALQFAKGDQPEVNDYTQEIIRLEPK